ncbi:hypothetical protein CHS0354_038723 [Potamilus streckersoni]|uniref:THD domain-containing protein n=1 Tax=Potamilus streckersoni TaxID=2493646 RepID=A0AAE0SG67_9BIVA|nr:hypothetical protein CHS0354_038723 [Potamilus streckersoni]
MEGTLSHKEVLASKMLARSAKTKTIQHLTAFVLFMTLAVLVTVLALLYTMPKPSQQLMCERLCLPSDPFSQGSEVQCACGSNRLEEYLAQAISMKEKRLIDEEEAKITTGPSPQLMGLLKTLRWNIKPSARVTGKKQSLPRAYDGEMISVREWHEKDDRAFLRYGMEYRHGRLVVPAKGTYFVHSFLDLYETIKNTSSPDDTIPNKRHADNYQLSPSIKHSIYRFNIVNGIEEELLRTEHPREVAQNGYFNIYDSYLSAAVNLEPGDELYVKISDLDLLAHPNSNFFGVSMI